MWEFIKFVGESIARGFSGAGWVMTSAEAICLILMVHFWIKGQGEEELKTWEEATAKWAKRSFVIVFAINLCFYAPYTQFRDEREAKEKAERIAPKLEGEIEQFYFITGPPNPTNARLFLQVQISNSGKSPSFADAYRLELETKNKNRLKAEPIEFDDEINFTIRTPDHYWPFVLKRPEFISEKTATAINEGQGPRGWLGFNLPKEIQDYDSLTNYLMLLSFRDVRGNRITVTNDCSTPSTKHETLEFPRMLAGSAVPFKKSDVRTNEPTPKFSKSWLPPELPTGCSNVTVFFGSQGQIYPMVMAQIARTGTKLQIKDLPDYLATDFERIPNYTARNRELHIKWDAQSDFGFAKVDLPALPLVISNRLFVDVMVPYLSGRRPLYMSDQFDSELTQLPPQWDRNYSTTHDCYEVVNEYTNPVLQVFYTSPSEVHVHGVFVVNTNQVLQSFGTQPLLMTMTYRLITNYTAFTNSYTLTETNEAGEITTHFVSVVDTNSIGEVITNAMYSQPFPNQRAIFKYPSNRHPGDFADWFIGKK